MFATLPGGRRASTVTCSSLRPPWGSSRTKNAVARRATSRRSSPPSRGGRRSTPEKCAPSTSTTAEGEYAALVTVSATLHLGIVFGDDFQLRDRRSRRDGRRWRADGRACARLGLRRALGLGVRRRRYRYFAPRGWQEQRGDLVSEWFLDGFPGNAAMLSVYPAEPADQSAAEAFDEPSWTTCTVDSCCRNSSAPSQSAPIRG